jgi:hypothetical protein
MNVPTALINSASVLPVSGTLSHPATIFLDKSFIDGRFIDSRTSGTLGVTGY